MNFKKHAIIIPGLLRCIDKNLLNFLDSAVEAQIFIVTERSYAAQAAELEHKYSVDVFYIEDASDLDMGIPYSHLYAVHPEFLKQEVALKRLTMWEEVNEQRFEYIHKLRTDMRYNISFDEFANPLLSLTLARDSLLAFWTLCISGHRDTMLKLA